MQKLTYQNLRGEQAVFFHAPYVLCKLRGAGMCDREIKAAEGAYQQGESVTGVRREGRKLKLTLHLMANSRAEMYRLRSELAAILSPDRAFDGANRARVVYENDYGRRWTWAVPESGLDWGERKQNVQPSVTLTFRCESPYWFGIGENELDFRARTDGLIFPARFPMKLGSKVFGRTVRNGGQSDAPVTVVIEGCGEKPALANDSTGAELRLISPLPVGDVLTIVTDPADLRVTVGHADGTEESGFGLLDPASSVAAFALRPGDNELRYAPNGGSGDTLIRLNWYDRYEGV